MASKTLILSAGAQGPDNPEARERCDTLMIASKRLGDHRTTFLAEQLQAERDWLSAGERIVVRQLTRGSGAASITICDGLRLSALKS